VGLVFRAGFDPGVEQLFFLMGERFVAFRRRHEVVLVGGVVQLDEPAFFGISGNEGLAGEGIRADVEAGGFLVGFRVGAVAEKTLNGRESKHPRNKRKDMGLKRFTKDHSYDPPGSPRVSHAAMIRMGSASFHRLSGNE
jgi:hypothetical protein